MKKQFLTFTFGALGIGLLLVFAAWSSAISLIEPAVTWLVEKRGMSRVSAAVWSGLATWLLGLGTLFSFNIGSEVKLFGKTFFDLLDFLTANIMLPLGGLAIAIFAVWAMSRQSSVDELAMGDGVAYGTWRFLVRYVTPFAVVIVFFSAVGIIGGD